MADPIVSSSPSTAPAVVPDTKTTEADATTVVASVPAEAKPDRRDTYMKKMRQETSEARREAAEAKAELEKISKRLGPEAPKEYKDVGELLDTEVESRVNKALTAQQAKQQEAHQASQKFQSFDSKFHEFAKDKPDAWSKISETSEYLGPELSKEIAAFALDSKVGPELLHTVMGDIDMAEKLAGMTPKRREFELMKLEDKISDAHVAAASATLEETPSVTAPKIPAPLGKTKTAQAGKAKSLKELAKETDLGEYFRQKKLAEKKK